MSLHLIESKKLVSKANRKRGGTFFSVVVHGLAIAGVYSVASASPVADKIGEMKTLVYVAPPPTPTIAHASPAAGGASASSARDPQLVIHVPDMANINVDIPPVTIDYATPVIDAFSRDFRSRGKGGPGGGDGGTGTEAVADPAGIFSDLKVDKQVVALSGYRTPRYPESMRAMGVETTITATFVVDTMGRIEPGSLTFGESPYPQFYQAVRDALANARFRPAEVHGQHVRQLVSQAFVFSLSRS